MIGGTHKTVIVALIGLNVLNVESNVIKPTVPRSPEWEGYPTIPMDFYQYVLKHHLNTYMTSDVYAYRVNQEFERLMNESTK